MYQWGIKNKGTSRKNVFCRQSSCIVQLLLKRAKPTYLSYQQVFVPSKPFDGYSRTIQEGVCFILFWQTFPFLAKSFTTLQLKIERLCTFLYAR